MMVYDKFTRFLHWGFALLVPLQLLSESFMKHPKPGRIRDDVQVFFFDMHEWIGMTALVFVLLRLVWGLVSVESSWLRLFPYFSATGRQILMHELKNEVPSWFKGKISEPSHGQGMAGAVHGVGLLLVLAMGATGAVMFYGMSASGQMLGFVHDAKEVHEALGGLLWAYIIAHVGMAALHVFVGHTMFKRMFSFKD